MKYSGIIRRGIAYIIDNIILAFVFSLTHFLFFGIFFRHVADISISFVTHPVCITFLFIYFAYFIFLEFLSGATIGKKICGIKVIKKNKKSISFKESFIRNIMRLVDGIFFYAVGLISIFISVKNQRLGDKAAETIIIKDKNI